MLGPGATLVGEKAVPVGAIVVDTVAGGSQIVLVEVVVCVVWALRGLWRRPTG
jgi:hypothetical protein